MSDQSPANHDRGAFEGKVCSDLEWLKAAIRSIQCLCEDRGKRISECESSVLVMQGIVKCAQGHEERIRGVETSITKVKAVGGVLGTIGGLLSGIAFKLWGSHS